MMFTMVLLVLHPTGRREFGLVTWCCVHISRAGSKPSELTKGHAVQAVEVTAYAPCTVGGAIDAVIPCS